MRRVKRGGASNDFLLGTNQDDYMEGRGGDDVLYSGPGNDQLMGDNGNDALDGGSGSDRLNGGWGNDSLYGGTGNDMLIGSWGADVFYGDGMNIVSVPEGNDIFAFSNIYDSRPENPDTIYVFTSGFDKLDLRAIDANINMAGNQSFELGLPASGAPGWLMIVRMPFSENIIVLGDVNGDAKEDFSIALSESSVLRGSDIIL